MMLDAEKWRLYYGDRGGGIIWPYPNGDRFRSKTEAHWAIYFNALGIRYEYEPEWFNGKTNCRPDFFLPYVGTLGLNNRAWIEIKPFEEPTHVERLKAQNLAFQTKTDVYIFCGHPWSFFVEAYCWHPVLTECECCGYIGCSDIFDRYCPNCKEVYIKVIGYDVRCTHKVIGYDVRCTLDVIVLLVINGNIPKIPYGFEGNIKDDDHIKCVLFLECGDDIDINKALYISRTTRFDYWVNGK